MKFIKTPTNITNKAIELFKKHLKENSDLSNKITFKLDLDDICKSRKLKTPVVAFSEIAKQKIDALVDQCDSEIGWHGIVERKDNKFFIKDILVYPQTVTGVTVEVDDEDYSINWLQKLDDETFNALRMQGHSHVNMSTSPSGTDMNTYKKILDTLSDEDYYIFMIVNKRGTLWINIYDNKNNVIFEKNDISIIYGNNKIQKWAQDTIKTFIKKEPKRPEYPESRYAQYSFFQEPPEGFSDAVIDDNNAAFLESLRNTNIRGTKI